MIDETWYVRPPGLRGRTSAGGVVVRHAEGEVQVALTTERGLDREIYILPKGGVKRGETLEQTALREIEEEAGFTDLCLLAPLGARGRLDYARTKWITTHYFLFSTGQVQVTPTDLRHAYETRWFPLHALPAMLWPEQRALIEENQERIVELVGSVRA